MEPLVIALTVVSSILAVFLIALGIQIFLILKEVRETLSRINRLSDTIEHSALRALAPISNMGDFGIALLSFVLTQNKDNPEFQSMRKSVAGFLLRFADSIEES